MAIATDADVIRIYNQWLNRQPNANELPSNGGNLNIDTIDLENRVKSSPEARSVSSGVTDAVVTKIYKDNIGRNPNLDELPSHGGNIGISAQDLENRVKNSPEAKTYNTVIKPWVDMVNVAPNNMPPFQWGEAEQTQAKAYAEQMYGPYFAGLLNDFINDQKVASERLEADTATKLQETTQQLSDYVAQSETDKQRLEEDYAKARDEEAKNLGVDLEAIGIAKSRGAEDTDRQLAEIQVDYERTGGRITSDKAKQLGRLLSAKETKTGRLNEDEKLMLDEIKRVYGQKLEQTTENMRDRGLTYSGLRTKAEGEVAGEQTRQEAGTALTAERGRQDINQEYGYNVQDVEEEAKRRLEDVQTERERSAGGVTRSYQRNLADLLRQEKIRTEQSATTQEGLLTRKTRGETDIATERAKTEREAASLNSQINLARSRGLEDIARELEIKKKAIEEEKQTQIETGYYGIGPQEQRKESDYWRRYANADIARTDPSRIAAYGLGAA